MAILATLLAIAAPRYFESVDRAKDAALRTDLRMMREAIDKFRADTGQYPKDLKQLVDARYLRAIPKDPVTDSASTWSPEGDPDGVTAGMFDVHSGAAGRGRDGTSYASW
jgi:general secretion pathway protein G